jgi:3-oxoacyl-[acyl-carrier-protein] synthase II
MAGLASMGALSKRNDDPQHASRPSIAPRRIPMGEGSLVLVLESLEHARRAGRILGAGRIWLH